MPLDLVPTADCRGATEPVVSAVAPEHTSLHIPIAGKGHTLASTLTVLQPWCWWLTIAGVRAWSNRSWLFCSAFVLIPILRMYGAWAAFSWR